MRRPPALPRPGLVLLALPLVVVACGGRDLDPGDEAPSATSVVVSTDPGDDAAGSNGDDGTTGDDGTAAGSTTTGGDGSGDDETSTTESSTTTEAAAAAADSTAWADDTHRLVEVARLDVPIAMATRPGSPHLWIAERAGRVRLVERRTDGAGGRPTYATVSTPVIDIAGRVTTSGEGGLLGIDFSADGSLLYLSYTNRGGNSILAEYPMTGDQADADRERILIQIDQPFRNHNGGQVTRGPDGFLYLAMGDGGSGGDPLDSGQDTSTLLGAVLRIDPFDPAGETAYGIPADNPFANGVDGRPEIWLYGVRNPWRFSFDRANGDLWIGDVGQGAVEEVTYLQAGSPAADRPAGRGANLGWRLMEGDRVFDGDGPPPDHAAPIYTYDHSAGRCSVTGGYVYRGQRIPNLAGVYLFADYCTGELFGLRAIDQGLLVANLGTDRGAGNVISFGEDADGEVYVLSARRRGLSHRRPGLTGRLRCRAGSATGRSGRRWSPAA